MSCGVGITVEYGKRGYVITSLRVRGAAHRQGRLVLTRLDLPPRPGAARDACRGKALLPPRELTREDRISSTSTGGGKVCHPDPRRSNCKESLRCFFGSFGRGRPACNQGPLLLVSAQQPLRHR
eukprot:754981-Hanusia_phi.AAC.1